MNKVYEQWKKVLASPAFFAFLAFFALTFLYVGLSFIFNLIYILVEVVLYVFHKGPHGLSTYWGEIVRHFKSGLLGPFSLHSHYPTVEFLVFGVCYVLLIYRLVKRFYKMRIAYRDINKGTKGTSRWMQEKEIERTYDTFDIDSVFEMLEEEGFSVELPAIENFVSTLEKAGFPIAMSADRKHMYIETDNTNFKVVGTSQAARKTQLIFYWLLYLNIMAKNPDSQLINDLKGDMLMKFIGSPAKNKFDVYALNFIQPLNSMRYNPFTVVWKYAKQEKMDDAEIALAGIGKQWFAQNSKDQDFVDGASATFTAISLVLLEFAQEYNRPQWFSLAGFYDLVLNFNRTESENEKEFKPLDEYMKSKPASSQIAKHYMTATSATKKQIQSFYFLLSTTLKDFALSSILQLTSESDLDFEKMAFPDEGQKPIVVFVSFPYTNNVFEKIQGVFYSQMIDVLSKKAQLSPGQKFKRRVRLGLDEVQNSPRIEGLSEAMNVGQQMGLLVGLGIQSYAGFKKNYPDEEGDAILAAAPGTMYLISDDPDDAEDISKRLGDATYVAYNRLGDMMSLDKSITEMEEERRLMKPDEVMRIAQNEAIYMNVKKRTDKEGKDVVPNPIYAKKKRKTKMRNVPGEPRWKKLLGFAKQEEETVFESYMELLPAFEHLFKGQKHEFFDDHGLGLEDVDLRKYVKKDEYGKEMPFNIEEYHVPHEIVRLTIALQMNKNNPDFTQVEEKQMKERLEELKKEIQEGTYYQKPQDTWMPDDEVPQELSADYIDNPLVIPEGAETSEEISFSNDTLLTDFLQDDYEELKNFLTDEQWAFVEANLKTLGQFKAQILESKALSYEKKEEIVQFLEETTIKRRKENYGE